jgi:hypothetical protein
VVLCPDEIIVNESEENGGEGKGGREGRGRGGGEGERPTEVDFAQFYGRIMETRDPKMLEERSFYKNLPKGSGEGGEPGSPEKSQNNPGEPLGGGEPGGQGADNIFKLQIPTRRFFAQLEMSFTTTGFRSYNLKVDNILND